MANAIWNEKEQRWTLRVTSDGVTRKFTSVKSGMAGKREVLRKSRQWLETDNADMSNKAVTEVWAEFLGHVKAKNGEESVPYRQAECYGRLYILPTIGHKKLCKVSHNDYQSILNNAKPVSANKDVLSKKYLKNIRANINLFLKYCVVNEYCEPLKGELYIPAGHPTIGKEVLQPSDVAKLFNPPSSKWYYSAFLFGVCTGMRPGEILGLQLDDYDGKNVTIRRSVNYQGQITEGKNKNARRVVPLHPIAIKIIEDTIKRNESHKLYTEWIFCGIDGGKGNQHTMGGQWRSLKRERSLPGSLYSFRHTFISMVKNTMPEQLVKAVVGHSVNMDSFGVYGHVLDGELQQAAEIMDLTFRSLKVQDKGTSVAKN